MKEDGETNYDRMMGRIKLEGKPTEEKQNPRKINEIKKNITDIKTYIFVSADRRVFI